MTCWLVFCCFPVVVQADGVSIDRSIDRIDVGINGIYKTGYWTPITVHFGNSDGDSRVVSLEQNKKSGVSLVDFGKEADFEKEKHPDHVLVVETLDSDGALTRFSQSFAKEDQSVTLLFRPGLKNGTVKLGVDGFRPHVLTPQGRPELMIPSEKQAFSSGTRFPLPVDSDRPIYLVLATEQLGLQDALSLMGNRESSRPLIMPIHSFADLPKDAVAYESIDTVVLSTEPKIYEGITAGSPQILALKRWLQHGGNVLFAAGKDSEPLVSGEDAPLAAFLPGTFEQMTTLRLSAPYEIYAAQLHATGSSAMTMTGSEEFPFLEVPFFRDVHGKVEVQEGDLPLVVRRADGLGLLTYFAGDLGVAPFSKWKDRDMLVARLLGAKDKASSQHQRTPQALMQLGYSDFAGQLRSALDQFSQVRAIPFSVIVGLSVFYVFFIGIGDWFVVHKLLKRPSLTWLTFPCWMIFFFVIVAVMTRTFQPNRILMNQAEVIDIDTKSGIMRGTSWMTLYSPDSARYDLKFYPGIGKTSETMESVSSRLAWFGLSGSAIGGMNPKTVTFTQWGEPYYLGNPPDVIREFPMQVTSTRSLVANWESVMTSSPVGELVEQEDIPVGHIINTLDCDLEQCFLVYGRWMIELPPISAGALVEVSTTCKRRELRTVVAGGRTILADDRIGSQMFAGKYNTESRDIPYILRGMMFHRAAGGQMELGLQNGYQQTIDTSRLLLTDSAIFIGVVKQDEFRSLGSRVIGLPFETDRRTTVIRAVFPVTR